MRSPHSGLTHSEMFAKNSTELFTPVFGPITFQLVEAGGKVTAMKGSDGREFARMED